MAGIQISDEDIDWGCKGHRLVTRTRLGMKRIQISDGYRFGMAGIQISNEDTD